MIYAGEFSRGTLDGAGLLGLPAGELREAVEALENGVSYDAVAVCIERALDALLELTGKRASQAVVDSVFSRFCVGK